MKKNKNKNKIILMLNLTIILAASYGCATQGKSLAFGGAVGAGSGAIIGGIADPGKDGQYRTRNVIIGSAIGGVAGMATAALVHSRTENKTRVAYEEGRLDSEKKQMASGTMPSLKNPKVEARWVDGKITGNRYVEGHFEYVIVEPARWEE
jgi:hypothetical protein